MAEICADCSISAPLTALLEYLLFKIPFSSKVIQPKLDQRDRLLWPSNYSM